MTSTLIEHDIKDLIKDNLMRMEMSERMVTDKMASFRTGHCTEEMEETQKT
jgi:hypothetical protein